jgi:hypothetical protein
MMETRIHCSLKFHTVLMVAMLCVCCGAELCAAATVDGRSFHLRVMDSYTIRFNGSEHEKGGFIYGWVENGPPGRVEHVLEYSHHGQFIFGKRLNDFFILDTLNGSVEGWELEPLFFENQAEWEDAFKARGVPLPVQLTDPLQVAAAMTDQELFPRKYWKRGGKLGLTDQQWAGYSLLLAILLSVFVGFTLGKNAGVKWIIWLFVFGSFSCMTPLPEGPFFSFSIVIFVLVVVSLLCFTGLFFGRFLRWLFFCKEKSQSLPTEPTAEK